MANGGLSVDTQGVAQMQQGYANATSRHALTRRQKRQDTECRIGDVVKTEVGRLRAEKMRAEARLFHVALEHCLPNRRRVQGQMRAGQNGVFVEVSHG